MDHNAVLRTNVAVASTLKLFDQVRQVLRVRHYSYETEKSYIHWIKRFIAFHQMKSPREMGAAEVEAF
ncbi:MAG: phage integrase N-terminal SAM-like domain-containing protein [Tildeniella torsiva UHER 1998/13D]|nr:phage integrase N-terminal SAM-like domain-containing protein [Tildeniella torsiva UHER 1998/13D]